MIRTLQANDSHAGGNLRLWSIYCDASMYTSMHVASYSICKDAYVMSVLDVTACAIGYKQGK